MRDGLLIPVMEFTCFAFNVNLGGNHQVEQSDEHYLSLLELETPIFDSPVDPRPMAFLQFKFSFLFNTFKVEKVETTIIIRTYSANVSFTHCVTSFTYVSNPPLLPFGPLQQSLLL